MRKHWRDAVRARRGYGCIWDGCHKQAAEVHHYVHVRYKLSRWDVQNGLPLCTDHHRQADRLYGRELLRKYLDVPYLEGLSRYRTLKEYLSRTGQTEAEFLNTQLERLKAEAKEAQVPKR